MSKKCLVLFCIVMNFSLFGSEFDTKLDVKVVEKFEGPTFGVQLQETLPDSHLGSSLPEEYGRFERLHTSSKRKKTDLTAFILGSLVPTACQLPQGHFEGPKPGAQLQKTLRHGNLGSPIPPYYYEYDHKGRPYTHDDNIFHAKLARWHYRKTGEEIDRPLYISSFGHEISGFPYHRSFGER